MRTSICGKMLLAGACMMTGVCAWGQLAQTPQGHVPSSTDVAIVYNALQANSVGGNGFWLQGGSVQFHQQLRRGFGVAADISGLHTDNMGNSKIGLDLITTDFGLRYTWSPKDRRYALFGQALGGETHALHSVFSASVPASGGVTDSANSMAMQLGGGVDLLVSRHISIRAIQADWLRTQLPNNASNVQNNLRLGMGFVYRIK